MLRLRTWSVAVLAAALTACASPSAPTDASPSPDRSMQRPGAPSSSAQPAATAAPSALAPAMPAASGAPADAGPGPEPGDAGSVSQTAPAASETAAAAAAPAIVADNNVKPAEGSTEELQGRAKGLFEAIVKDEPALGDPFWFPREPFIPLKDVKGPEKYWKNLHQAYASDIHKAHKKRKSWEGAAFLAFDVGSTPKWVKPGDEANKIGYYRSFHGKLRYEFEGKKYSVDVHTVITWQGRWYVTHLGKFKK